MAEAEKEHGEQREHLEHRHETTDANVKAVFTFAVILVTTIVVVGIVSAVYYYFLSRHYPHAGIATAPVIDKSQAPPPPRLQTQPQQDLKKMREYEDQRLNSYGWIDKPAGIVRIPIDQAIDLVAKRGLPYRQTPPPKQAGQEKP